MDPTTSSNADAATDNGPPTTTDSSRTMSASTTSLPSAASTASAWSAQMSTFPTNASSSASSSFPQFSASTAAILERLQGKGGHASGSAAFEAKRAEILQNYVTSDNLPTPPPVSNSARRGRGGRIGTPSGPKADAGNAPASASSARASGRGRGRGRGRGGGRGGKRKRSESDDESGNDDDSDISSSYTPLPTRTKSGRSVNKPVAFVPTLPEPSQGVKRRKSTKTLLAAKCKTCHRETEPANNRIVFCDACSTAYHQYCHNPPISNDVVAVLEMEWLCGPCVRTKQSVGYGIQDLVAAESLSIDEKRAYFSTLPTQQLVSLLLTAVIRHPELPVFPHNVRDLVPSSVPVKPQQQPQPLPPPPPNVQPPSQTQYQQQQQQQQQQQHTPAFHPPIPSQPNGHTLASHNFSSHSDTDPAEAQLLGEIRSHVPQPPPPPPPLPTLQSRTTTIDLAGNQYEEDDGYDTDPPAHYPKPGNGLARTLRPESEDLNWLVDDNFEVFSHGWKGDGTGMGADGTLDAVGGGGAGTNTGAGSGGSGGQKVA